MPGSLTHRCISWLRSAWLARCVTLAFLLAMGLAQAGALLKPQSMELLCTSSGAMKLLIKSPDGSAQDAAHTVHCGLCVFNTLGDGLPPASSPSVPASAQAVHAQASIASVRIAPSAPPLPARGPPSYS